MFFTTLVHVNDLLIACNNMEAISSFKKFDYQKSSEFKFFEEMKWLGPGEESTRHNKRHALDVINEVDVHRAKPVDTFMERPHGL